MTSMHFQDSFRRPRVVPIIGIAATATGAFAGIAWTSASRASAHADRKAGHKLARPRRSKARRAATAVGPLGKWYTQLAIAAVVAGVVAARSRSRRSAKGAAAIMGSALLATAAGPLFDRLLPQPPPPPARSRRKSVFPSGHTFAPLGVALTVAYVAEREGLVDGRIAFPIAAAIPVITASGKLFARKHWPTDVAGGYAAGVAIAATVIAIYEASLTSTPVDPR